MHSDIGNSGNKEEGMAHLNEGINLEPDNSNSHVRFAQALLDQGKIDEGRGHLIKAASLKPDYRTLRQVADIMLQKGQIDFAVEHYLKAIEIEPSDYISLNNLASISAQQGKVKEAAEYYRKAININPNLVQSLVGLAKILVSKKTEFRNVEEAIRLSSKACEVTQNKEIQPLLLLAATNAEGGHYQDAVKAAKIASELANSSGDKNLSGIIQKNIEFYMMSESKQK
jgi:cytochrome c-type biogenesis protein CcmH/NrfG